ncbi:PilC/PilY family type IV pilus protein [Desulfopila sp. IMCC35008]|uniref:PilC/PilY family type IV pilus protein n=1 Tax=Desulfopila sp. IMCC35008 TaxID=2653858 RepID=UPI0013D4F3CF|nr:PilC/PilY family type IV pilus protein [Desulfopila sp. IMCC35008]
MNKKTIIKLIGLLLTLVLVVAEVSLADVNVVANDPVASEPSADGQFTVTTTSPVVGDTTVTYSVDTGSGHAIEGTDYQWLSGSVLIPDGSSSATIDVNVLDDTRVEGDQTVTVRLTGASPSAGAISTTPATVTIESDDIARLTISDVSRGEDSSTLSFTITSDKIVVGVPVEVNFATNPVSADAGLDFVSNSGVATILNGTSADVVVSLQSDDIVEADETFELKLTSASSNALIDDDTGVATIIDADVAAISVNDVSINESDGQVSFSIASDKTIEGTTVSVLYSTAEGTAKASLNDYTPQSGTATISSGNTTNINVPVLADTVVEKDEIFYLQILNPSPNATIVDSLGEGTIVNDDIPTITVNDSSVSEGNGTVYNASGITYQSSLEIAADAELQFDYNVLFSETDSSDFVGVTSGTIAITTGLAANSSRSVPLTISADEVVEYDEDYVVQLTGASIVDGTGTPVASDTANGVILNDDVPVLSLITATNFTPEGDPPASGTFADFTVESDHVIAPMVLVTFDVTITHGTTEAGDVQTGTFNYSIHSGNQREISVGIIPDLIVENDESYTVTISNANLSDSAVNAQISTTPGGNDATGVIQNDDFPTITLNDTSVLEGDSGDAPPTDPKFTATTDLEIDADTKVVVDWHMVHGTTNETEDFVAPYSGTIEFTGVAAGDSVFIPVLIFGDIDVVEPDEKYTVELSNGAITDVATSSLDFGLADVTDTGDGTILADEFYVTMIPGSGGEIIPVANTMPDPLGYSERVVVNLNSQPIFEISTADQSTFCDHIESITAEGSTNTGFDNGSHSIDYTFSPITKSETIEATFTVDRWQVTSNIVGESHGAITSSDYHDGCTSPIYTVQRDGDYHISFVDVDGTFVEGPNVAPFTTETFNYEYTDISADHTITAAFTQMITVIEDSDYGTISPDPGDDPLEVSYDYLPVFTIEALSHATAAMPAVNHIHHISDIIVDDVSSGIRGDDETGPYNYTYPNNITSDSTVEVQFTGFVDVEINGPGKVSLGLQEVTGTGSIEFEADTDQIVLIEPGMGYHIEQVLVDGADVGRVSEYNFNEESPVDHVMEVKFSIDWYSIEPSSTFDTIFDDAGENTLATTKYPTYGDDLSFYVDLNDPAHAIEAIFIDNVRISLPATDSTYTDPGGVYELNNTADDTLEVKFTNVTTSHRLVVLDYDITPISDVPLVASSVTAPANIMYIIDDSGSMSWSTMVPGIEQGKFCVGGTGAYCSGGTRYTSVLQPGGQIPESRRMLWKSQWLEYNRTYYNPDVTYVPWPRVVEVSERITGADKRTAADADTYAPRFHPLDDSSVLILPNTFATLETKQIIDDEDPGFTVSNWNHWKERNAGDSYNNDNRRARGTAANKWATYTFIPTKDAEYEVLASWDGYTPLEDNVPYTISCPTCIPVINDTVYVNQKVDQHPYNGDPTYSLGKYDFEQRKEVTVTLTDTFGREDSSDYDAVKIVADSVVIPNAHYYVWSDLDNAPYLVTFDSATSSLRYYRASGTNIDKNTDNFDDEVTQLEEKTGADIPSDVVETDDYATALQNFANWVTYYRERRCAAISAVARSLVAMDGVQVGLSPLNDWSYATPVKKIKVDGEDYTDELLEILYDWKASGGTPLRNALEETGQYFANTDTGDWSSSLPSPLASEEDGGACQQNFAILMTDGYYNGGGYGSYNADNDNTSFVDSDGDYLYSGGATNTLADIAMYFYETDISSTLPNSVQPSPEETETHDDPANWQHMVTYTVSFGLNGTLDPDDYELRVDAVTPNYPDWPGVNTNEPETIDDLWHAAVNGRGKFLSASNPDDLVKSLLSIIENIAKRTGSGASVSINGDDLFETIGSDIRTYQTSYNTSSWYGDLRSFKIVSSVADEVYDADDNGIFDTSVWSASAEMQNMSYTSRKLFTFNTDTEAGAEFSTTAGNLSDEQVKLMTPYFAYGTRTNDNVLDYLRGDSSYEVSGGFRTRVEPLGDFVNSQAQYLDEVLYVGGNDGMLHAFDATDANGGEEIFAYIPGLVYQNLRELANPGYTHKFYVDNTPYVTEVSDNLSMLVGGLGKGGKGYFALDVTNPAGFSAANVMWEYPAPPAILIKDQTSISFSNPGGGNDYIRDGGDGFTGPSFAPGSYITVIGADCTNYTNNGTFRILARNSDGEIEVEDGSLIDTCGDGNSVTITESISDKGIGYSFSGALLLKTNDSKINPSHELEGYVVIFGNGYASEDGTAQLYILDPVSGDVLKKFDTGVGPANGMSTPKAIDVDNDLTVDYVYAGDLLGNMWKFDLTAGRGDQTETSNPDKCTNSVKCYEDWQVAFCDGGDQSTHCNKAGAVPKPLFKTAKNQAITAAPDVSNHPSYNGYIVVFGTGKFLGQPDLTSTYTQSFYGLWDWAPDQYDAGYLGERIDSLEDIDRDGRLDVDEDANNNGVLDVGEDIDGDGNLDIDEDLNGNGKIDALTATTVSNSPNRDATDNPLNTLLRQEALVEQEISEDADGDGNLDVNEDKNNNQVKDPDETDENGDGDFDLVDEDVNQNGVLDTYDYYRIVTQYSADWTVGSTIDVNYDGTKDPKDKVPQNNVGWYFDLPGKITANDNVDNDNDGIIDEAGERALGERVTTDALIRDGRAILISFGVTGSVCDVGLYSFLNERDYEDGGRLDYAVYDIDGDGDVDEDDMVMIYENGEGDEGPPSDVGEEGRIFNPAILEDPLNPGTEIKLMSTSTGKITTVREKAEKRGVYYWQQIQ